LLLSHFAQTHSARLGHLRQRDEQPSLLLVTALPAHDAICPVAKAACLVVATAIDDSRTVAIAMPHHTSEEEVDLRETFALYTKEMEEALFSEVSMLRPVMALLRIAPRMLTRSCKHPCGDPLRGFAAVASFWKSPLAKPAKRMHLCPQSAKWRSFTLRDL
jgi:hypothetical protein